MKTKSFGKITSVLFLLTATFIPAFLYGQEDLAEIRAREKKIQDVVAKSVKAMVAISDGSGSGSGVIVSEDGIILTAGHVIMSGARRFQITLSDGRQVEAALMGRNLNIDAGMLQITEEGSWPHVELGYSTDCEFGQWVVGIGHPGGYELGRTAPVRTGKIVDFQPDQMITDCALVGGDSGGPLFDLDGNLIAIHSSIGDSIAENRHVSIDSFREIWDRLVKKERWGRLPDFEEPVRAAIGVRVDRGNKDALITQVHLGTAADDAGMKSGDIVVEAIGRPVKDADHLVAIIKQRRPGQKVPLVVKRGDQTINLEIKLGRLGS